MAGRKSPVFDTATTLGKIIAFFGVSAICGVLAAGLLVPIASLAGSSANASIEFFEELPAELKKEPLSVPSRVLANDGTELASFYAENRKPVSADQISQSMKDAIIAIEDYRFYEHGGVDLRGMARAVVSNLTSSSQQGASTLTMQYVNNVLINAGVQNGVDRDELTISGTKTYGDKLREAKLAIAVEKEMSKEEILEGYLNLVLFSGRTYGVEAAAQRFFSVSAADLSIPQAATLAGMVQIPNVYNPVKNPELTEKRRNTVLGAMLRTGKITQAEYDEAVATPLVDTLNAKASNSGCIASPSAPYFCDYVRHIILADPAYGETVEDRERLLNRGGLTIQTTLDLDAQEKATKAARETIPADDASNMGTALVSVEPGTGKVLAMAQNKTYGPQEGSEYTTYNFSVDRAHGGTQNGFQGGSTMKPFTAIAWLQSGRNMWDRIDARRDSYPASYKWKASCLSRGYAVAEGGWKVNNASQGFKRRMTVDDGLYWSVNTATAAEAAKVDLCDISEAAAAVGIVDQTNRDKETGQAQPINPANPSFIIGSAGVTPLSMAAGFAAFANNGEYCAPRALVSVTDADGNSYPVPAQDCEQALDPKIIRNLNGTLSKIADRRVDREDKITKPIAGKTGTNDNASSTWFVGYTTGIATASWVGRYTDSSAIDGEVINGKRYDFLDPNRPYDSSTLASPMWLEYMHQVVPNYPAESFGRPESKPSSKDDDDSDRDSNSNSRDDSEDDSEQSSQESNESGDSNEESDDATEKSGDSEESSARGNGRGNGGGNGNGNGNGNGGNG
ncbi:transglycosylase domain-containing protein [Zhihengliuella sp.]|uniref:transglycosylase domain-containing protein n=1 Tax=Zhihengliuella sp. TaxID=1954483 RepID=UPI0028113B0D|nr:transglycosylase domain-containing protein [Zhihengliuella sp.]